MNFHCTNMKSSIKDFFSKCDQMRSFLRIWSHLLKKSLTENLIFCADWKYHFVFEPHWMHQKYYLENFLELKITPYQSLQVNSAQERKWTVFFVQFITFFKSYS